MFEIVQNVMNIIIQWEWIREKKLPRSTTIYHPGKVDEKKFPHNTRKCNRIRPFPSF
jgi:hypothetical protein